MSGDPYQFFKQMARASQSAFIATPAFYKIADQFGSMVDQLSNSSSLNVLTDQMGKQFKLGDMMSGPNGVLAGIQQQVEGILLGGVMMSYFGGGSGGEIAQKAQAQANEEQIKKLLESKTKTIEHRMQMLAKMMYENAMHDEITRQEQKLGGSDMASASGYSEEKINAMQDLAYTTVMEPDDLEINA
jgi:hypothetical protein